MPSLQPLLPATTNLPLFYTVLVSVTAIAGLSAFVLWRRRRGYPPASAVVRWKLLALLPLWLLGLVWLYVAVSLAVVTGAVAGSWPYLLLALGLLPAYGLLNWGLYAWLRSRSGADVFMLLVVAGGAIAVYGMQRLWLCEPLALSGLGRAQLCTARLYEAGAGGAIRNDGTAREWYRRAAGQGVAEAEYRMAGFSRDRATQTDWLERAAGHGHAGADYRLYWLLEREAPARALAHLQAAVRRDHAGALYRLGVLHLRDGGGVARDPARTRTLWRRAAAAGYVSAARELAIAYAADGVLFRHDPGASRHWETAARRLARDEPDIPAFERALEMNWERLLQEARADQARVDAGDAAAQRHRGETLLEEAGNEPALVERGLALLERAARAGDTDAQYRLARQYLDTGPASETVRAQGRQWLVTAADGGHEAALRRLIPALKSEAHGFRRDLPRARDYGEALFAVLEARGVLRNQADWLRAGWEHSDTLHRLREEAERYLPAEELRQKSAAGDPAAQYHRGRELLATRYEEGMALMTAAALAGYPQAQYTVARSYRQRKRTEREERQAVEWFQAAADSGHRGAMVDLGVIYLQGIARIGLEQDPYRAQRLFEAALRDRDEVVYEEMSGSGRGWMYTTAGVNRWLDRIPEAIRRLEPEGRAEEPRQQRTRLLNENPVATN